MAYVLRWPLTPLNASCDAFLAGRTVREGWERLLHETTAHLYGTRTDALAPYVRTPLRPQEVDADRPRRDERRRAMATGTAAERAMLLEYLWRLCPVATPLLHAERGAAFDGAGAAFAGGAGAPQLHPTTARKVAEMRYQELKMHLRWLMPASVCPAGKGGATLEGEGVTAWLLPPQGATLPSHAQRLLGGIPAAYCIASIHTPSSIPGGTAEGRMRARSSLLDALCDDGRESSSQQEPPLTREPSGASVAASGEERSFGARLCCALAAVEISLSESKWSATVCGSDLLRVDRGRVAGSTDERTTRWERVLHWAMKLLAHSLCQCAWARGEQRTPAEGNGWGGVLLPLPLRSSRGVRPSLLASQLDVPRLFDCPVELALSLGILARKQWHLHLDACLGPGGRLALTDEAVDEVGHAFAPPPAVRPSGRLVSASPSSPQSAHPSCHLARSVRARSHPCMHISRHAGGSR